ncbi:hypothetical protein Asulf_01360 [Archaeoglobus sulfaticallidus PM70-1]|uniref:DNA 3'-5' helicase n=1 Tax=Archaeoglobus sulfaticallidus PM70-1 TaxID=387631 RepID=N0BLD2_9EURY|nr:DEAD/DEAH box helicase [Archaeoglobus sulfaticallidus]AGK61351.1 hypothetical protein Asulf_01360 [Archaeoglobus sulfaticallidus PM70-1]
MKISLYKPLSKFPFNFSIFKTAKSICKYLDGKITCNELLSICKTDDVKALVDYLIERRDSRFKEILASKPELLRLSEYTRFWKDVIVNYPEKAFEVLEKLDFIEDAKVIAKSLDGGVVALDVEISLDSRTIEAGGIVFCDNERFVTFYFSRSDTDKFLKLLVEVVSKSSAILVGHGILKHDLKFLSEVCGIDLKNKVVDTLYLHCLVEPGSKPRSLSMLVPHNEHDPVEDAKASLTLLKHLVEKLRQYELEKEAKELLEDNPYLSGLPHVIDKSECAHSSDFVSENCEQSVQGGEDRRELLVVADWRGLSNPWSPYIVDPASHSPRDVWESAAVFSAMCAIRDPKCGNGDPNTFRKTWVNDENTRKAILEVSKVVKKREVPKMSIETLSEYVPFLTGKFDRVVLYDGELVLSTAFNLKDFFRLSDTVLAYVSLAKAFSEISETIQLDPITFVDSGFKPALLLPESSSLDPLNIASNVAGLMDVIELPAVVLVSNDYEKSLAIRAFSDFCPTYVDDKNYGSSAFRLAIENEGVAITSLFERIPSGFKSLVVFSDKSIVKGVKGRTWAEKLAYGFMKVYGIARKIEANKIAYLSFSSGVFSDFLRIPEFGKMLAAADKMTYRRKRPRGNVFVRVWNSVEEAVEYAENITEEVWGFRYRPYQRKAVALLLSAYSLNRSTSPFGVVVLPTGSGKSVIFQSAAIALHKLTGTVTIVVSPLQALIHDHVEGLRRKGVRVAKIDSNTSSEERFNAILDAISGDIVLLYVTPERFERDELRVILGCGNVGFVILDEIHCLSTWGSTFRPSYKYMARMIASESENRFLPIYGFSATLPKDVLSDVLAELGIGVSKVREIEIDFDSDFTPDDVQIFSGNLVLRGPATRPEIKIGVIQAKNDEDKLRKVVNVIKQLRDTLDERGEPWIGLVFASFVRSPIIHENVDYIARSIEEGIGEEVLYFHGQMDLDEKVEVISKLERAVKSPSKPRIVVATKAFGMGVDLPNVRFVVHAHVSQSLEEYYQEIGRAGRDRKDSYAVTVFSPDDFDEKRQLIRHITYDQVNKLVKIIGNFRASNERDEIAIPLNPFYSRFGYSDGKATLKNALKILAENEVIDYEITNGFVVAYKVRDVIDLKSIDDALVFFDEESDVILLDTNSPKMFKAALMERLRKWENEGKLTRTRYAWRIGDKTIDVAKNGIWFEMGYITLKKDPSLENVSISKEFEYYQLQIRKLSQLERFLKEISSLPLKEQNKKAHETLGRYLEEGIANEFEKILLDRIGSIEEDVVDRLGDKAVIFGLTGSGKTEKLAELAAYYVYKYSDRAVVIVLPDRRSSDIVSRIRDYLGYDVDINIKQARNVVENLDELLRYEVIILDDADTALAKTPIDVSTLERIAKFNRKVYFAFDPMILAAFGNLRQVLENFEECNVAVLRSVELPVKVKADGLDVRVVQKEDREPSRSGVPTQIVKYLPSKFDGALLPAISPNKNMRDYYTLLYLCLKASKYRPANLKFREKDFGAVLTEWIEELNNLGKKRIDLK